MKSGKLLCLAAIILAGLLGGVFLLDLAMGIPFGRFDYGTDIIVIVAAGLIVWQGIETWNQL